MDTPPVNIVSDAVVLAAKTEGIVMVVRDGETTHDEFDKAVAALKFADANLLGAILNCSDETDGKYTSKSKKYKYY